MSTSGIANVDHTPLLDNDRATESSTLTGHEGEVQVLEVGQKAHDAEVWNLGDSWHNDLPDEDVSQSVKDYLNALNRDTQHAHHSHSSFLNFQVTPRARQIFLPSALGGGSSLAKTPHIHRSATTNDLVLDLVFVYILNVIVQINLKNLNTLSHASGHSSTASQGHGHHLLAESLIGGHNNTDHSSNSGYSLSGGIFAVIRDCIALFLPIFLVWLDVVTMLNRFEQKDAIHLLVFSINVFTFVFLGRTVKACAGDDYTLGKDRAIACDGYIYMLVICFFNVMLYHLYVLRFGDGKMFGNYLKEKSAWNILQGIVWLYTALVGAPIWYTSGNTIPFLIGWWLGLALQMGFLLGLASKRSRLWLDKKGVRSIICCCCPHGCVGKRGEDTNGSIFIPINTHVQVERFDLFVVLALGELVAGADVKGLVDDDHVTIKIVLAILTGLGIKFLAFDYAEHPTVSLHKSIDKRERVQHAFTASTHRGVGFTLSYIPLLLGVLLVASILEDHIMHDGLTMRLKRCIYGIGCFFILFSTTIIQMLHQGKRGGDHRIPKRVRILVRLIISFIMLLVPFFPIWCTDDDGSKCIRDAIIFEVVEACLFFFALAIDGWMRHPKKYDKDLLIYNAVNKCCRFK